MVKIDIEMPTYCYDCPCNNGENGRCNITGDSTFDKRPFDCPLKEVKHSYWKEELSYMEEDGSVEYLITCANCSELYAIMDWQRGKYRYCPNCGAKMEE